MQERLGEFRPTLSPTVQEFRVVEWDASGFLIYALSQHDVNVCPRLALALSLSLAPKPLSVTEPMDPANSNTKRPAGYPKTLS